MNKLSLNAEDLQVESFATHGDSARRGTVIAFDTEAGIDTCSFCTEDCTDMNSRGVHCGPQGTMNPLWSECVTATMAGATCEGGTCGQACTYLNC
jgi:hypothetical protein